MNWSEVKSHLDTFYQYPENLGKLDTGKEIGESFKIGGVAYSLISGRYNTYLENYPLTLKWNYARDVEIRKGREESTIDKMVITQVATLMNPETNSCYRRYFVKKGKAV